MPATNAHLTFSSLTRKTPQLFGLDELEPCANKPEMNQNKGQNRGQFFKLYDSEYILMLGVKVLLLSSQNYIACKICFEL